MSWGALKAVDLIMAGAAYVARQTAITKSVLVPMQLWRKSMRNGFSHVTVLLLLIRYPEGKSEHRDGRI